MFTRLHLTSQPLFTNIIVFCASDTQDGLRVKRRRRRTQHGERIHEENEKPAAAAFVGRTGRTRPLISGAPEDADEEATAAAPDNAAAGGGGGCKGSEVASDGDLPPPVEADEREAGALEDVGLSDALRSEERGE